ncbi:MAG: hypothetical protein ABIH40_01575 [Candidatus Omnitrophota bacterium]
MNAQAADKIKKTTIAILQGASGIATEIGYALAIMAAALFISFLLTSF